MPNRSEKFRATSANAVSNTVTISSSTALITRASSRRVLRTSSSCFCKNSWRSSSASYSVSASGLIGPMSRSSRSSSRARAGIVMPSGTSGGSVAIAASGSQSNSVRTCSTVCSSRMRISACSISSRPACSAVLDQLLSRRPSAGRAARRACGRPRAPLRTAPGAGPAAFDQRLDLRRCGLDERVTDSDRARVRGALRRPRPSTGGGASASSSGIGLRAVRSTCGQPRLVEHRAARARRAASARGRARTAGDDRLRCATELRTPARGRERLDARSFDIGFGRRPRTTSASAARAPLLRRARPASRPTNRADRRATGSGHRNDRLRSSPR